MPGPSADLAIRLTAPGIGGMHVFGLQGPGVAAFLSRHFRPSRGARPDGSLVFGRLVDDQELIDEVLVRPAQPPFPWTELSIHGGVAVESRLQILLTRRGFACLPNTHAVMQPRAAWSAAAPDLSAEIGRCLAEAWSPRAAEFFASHYDGRLWQEISALIRALSVARSPIRPATMAGIDARLASLLHRSVFGLAMASPPRVVLQGCVNVGKSSLFNRLLGAEKAIVSEWPGTTRDANVQRATLLGYPFRLVDVAGSRSAADDIEASGIARSKEWSERADIVLEVRDFDAPVGSTGRQALGDRRVRVVLNKCDLHPDSLTAEVSRRRPECVVVSAVHALGLERLERLIVHDSVFSGPTRPIDIVPFTSRQHELLRSAQDVLATDTMAAISCLSAILGTSTARSEA